MFIIIEKVHDYVTGAGGTSLDTWYWIGRIVGYILQFAAGVGIGFAIRILIKFAIRMLG